MRQRSGSYVDAKDEIDSIILLSSQHSKRSLLVVYLLSETNLPLQCDRKTFSDMLETSIPHARVPLRTSGLCSKVSSFAKLCEPFWKRNVSTIVCMTNAASLTQTECSYYYVTFSLLYAHFLALRGD